MKSKLLEKRKVKVHPTSYFWVFFGSRLGQQLFREHSSVWRKFFDPGGSLVCSRSAVHTHLTSECAFDLRFDMRLSGFSSKQQLHGSSSSLPCLVSGVVLDLGMFWDFGSRGPHALLRCSVCSSCKALSALWACPGTSYRRGYAWCFIGTVRSSLVAPPPFGYNDAFATGLQCRVWHAACKRDTTG